MRSIALAVLVVALVTVFTGTVAQAQDAGQGAIVVRDTANAGMAHIYAHAEGPEIESEASQSQLAAGITTPQTHGLIPRFAAVGLLSHTYVFDTSHGPTGEKASGGAHPGKQTKALTNDDVIKLVKAELGDKVVIDKINSSPGDKLDTSTDALIRLKKAGVSKAVIDAMIKRGE